MNNIDLTKFGEEFINLILDLELSYKNKVSKDVDYYSMYLWGVKGENNEYYTGFNFKGSDVGSIISGFQKAFTEDPVLIPLVCTSIYNYIKNLDENKKKECLNAIKIILKL